MVWTLTRLGTRPGEEKHHLLADTDGARSDRGKLTSPPKDCSKVVLLALIYRCLDVPHRSVRYTHTTCGYTSTIITLHVYICWMFPYLVHASSESFYYGNLCMTIHINVIKSPVKKKIAKFATKFFFTQLTCTCIIHFPRLVELDKSLNIYINIVRSQFFTDSFYLYIHANKYI